MRRYTLRGLAVLLLAGLLPLAPVAAWADPVDHDALVVDAVSNDSSQPSAANWTYDSSGASVPVASPSTVVGGVRIARPASASSGPGIEVLPSDSAPLAVGHYAMITGQWSTGARPIPVVRMISTFSGCTQFAPGSTASGITAGWLDVASVTQDLDGVVTSLAATYRVRCSTGTIVVTGSIRYRADAAYASATSSVVSLGTIISGSHTPLTATITNRGSAPLELAAPVEVAHASDAPSLLLTNEGEDCSSAPLAAGASCTLHLEYVDDGVPGGGANAEVRLASTSLVRGYVSVLARATQIISPPGAPQSVQGETAYDGVRLRWQRNSSSPMPDGFRVRRVDGPSPVLLATVDYLTERWVDTTLAKGEQATYQVSAYNAGGETAAVPITLARPDLPDPPAAADRRVLAKENASSQTVGDSTQGDTVTTAPDFFGTTVNVTGGGTSFGFPRLPTAVGSYPLGVGQGLLYIGGCTGTVDVREAWIRADLTPYRVDADFHMMCGPEPVEVQVRLGVEQAYAALTTTGSMTAFQATVGQAADTRSLTLTNRGGSALSVGTPSISGNDASSFAITDNPCPATLAAGGSCVMQVAFTPTRSLAHFATLTFSTGTALGSRSVPLAGSAIGPPVSTSPSLQPLLGRVYVGWSHEADGGSPVTGYHVLRALATGDYTEVQQLGADAYSWIDTTVVPGTTYRYRVVAENQYGLTPLQQSPPSTAVVPREELVASVVDPFDNNRADLASAPVGNGSMLPFKTGQDTDQPTVSPDGKWLAYVEYDGSGDAGLWLRALDGSVAPRLLVDIDTADEMDPAWSPDSKTVAYSAWGASSVAVRRIAITAGAVSSAFPSGSVAAQPSWLADGSGIVVSDPQGLARITTAGTKTRINGAPADAWAPAVSPRGDRIAYVTTDDYGCDQLWLLPMNGGTPQTVSEDCARYYDRAVWAPDGSAVVANMLDAYGNPSPLSLLWHQASGAQPAGHGDVFVAGGRAVRGLGWRRLDVAAPVVTFPGTSGRTSTAAKIPVRVVDDTVPVGGLTVSCTVDGKAVGRCTNGWSGTLAAGTHTLKVVATDPHGRTSTTSYTWVVDASAPVISTTALPAFVLGTSVSFSYKGSDPAGIGTYDVRVRHASWADEYFTNYSSPSGWLGTTATSRSAGVAPGYEYCFSVRARDKVGNLSAWSAERCTAVPLDDRSLKRASGSWTSVSSSTSFKGTLTRSTVGGSSLTRTLTRVKRLEVVATTCSTCGYLDVYVNTTRVGRLSLVSSTTIRQRHLSLPVLSTLTAATITLKPYGSRQVLIDGLGIRHT